MFKPGLFYIEPSYYENKSVFYHPQALDQFCHAVGKNRFFLLKLYEQIDHYMTDCGWNSSNFSVACSSVSPAF